MDISKYHMVGRLVNDPETIETKAGELTKICVAVNKKVGGEDRASFFDIEGWDKMSERLSKFKKGQVGYFDGDFEMVQFPAKNKEGEEIKTKDGKPVMRRVVKFTAWGCRFGPGADGPKKVDSPKKVVAKTVTPDDAEEDAPW